MCINIQPVTTIYTIQLAIAIPQSQYSLTHLLYVPHSAPFSQISTTWTLYWGISRTHPLIPHTHTLPHQLESIQTGIVLSPVQTSLVKKKTESSAFIKTGDLIPTHLGLDDTVRSKLRCSITNITEWLQAFAVYISVIAKTQPHRISDLMGCQILIQEAGNELVQFFLGKHFKWFWLRYNVSNLQSARKNLASATAHPDMVDMDLHELSLGWMSGPYHTSACPDLCISRFGVIPKKKVINQIKWHLIMNGWAQGLWQRSWSRSYSPVSLGDLCYITVTLNSSTTMKDSLLLSAKAPQKTQL